MSLTAILLVTVSAFTHAAWNLLSKRQHPTAGFFLIGNTIGTLLFAPVILFYWHRLAQIPASVWILLVVTGFFMALYYGALAGAYRAGDMSLAYPLARSSPIIVVTFVALVLGRGDQISWQCVVGIVLVVAGCLVLPMKRFGDFRIRNYLNACCLLSLLAAIGTTGYSIADDEALRYLRELPTDAFGPFEASLLYIALEGFSSSFWQALFVVAQPSERRSFREELRSSKLRAALIGFGIYVTYTLVLAAMAFVENVSYVVAFRQLSIPIGAVAGMILLKEPRHRPKIIGLLALTVGLVLVGTG